MSSADETMIPRIESTREIMPGYLGIRCIVWPGMGRVASRKYRQITRIASRLQITVTTTTKRILSLRKMMEVAKKMMNAIVPCTQPGNFAIQFGKPDLFVMVKGPKLI